MGFDRAKRFSQTLTEVLTKNAESSLKSTWMFLKTGTKKRKCATHMLFGSMTRLHNKYNYAPVFETFKHAKLQDLRKELETMKTLHEETLKSHQEQHQKKSTTAVQTAKVTCVHSETQTVSSSKKKDQETLQKEKLFHIFSKNLNEVILDNWCQCTYGHLRSMALVTKHTSNIVHCLRRWFNT